MQSIVCIVGRPKSGKTTLLTGLIPEMKRRGYRVATIKHSSHRFEIDKEGTDSWKHAQSGSECAIISSENRVAVNREVSHDWSIAELMRLVPEDIDIVLAEGFKRSDYPRIEVHRHEVGELVCSPDELMAVVTDEPLELELPQYSPDDISGLADLVQKIIVATEPKDEIAIFADGKSIPLKPFVRDLYLKVISDMVASLKGFSKPKRIDISIKK
ncbi:MAG: molybdopterin-guanine dinucleotide biosynthesis protein B [Chloroflexi bacterium]|nr:molybdopterin-guanine dinucleotide biosynthesis protein B [Chloroflexota bacterium]